MATTLTLTPRAASASVVIEVTTTLAAPLTALTRTDANGVRPVRLQPGQDLIGGTLVVEDHEAALVGSCTYDVRVAAEARTASITLLNGGWRLCPTGLPQFQTSVDIMTGYDAARPAATIVHEVIGRPDPVARIVPHGSRRGTLTLWCRDYAAATATVDVYRRGEVVMLRQPAYPGLDMYHVSTDIRETGYDEAMRRWRVDVTYVEVAFPRGPLLGSFDWSWDDLVAAFPTWDAVVAAFPTWNSAEIGPLTWL